MPDLDADGSPPRLLRLQNILPGLPQPFAEQAELRGFAAAFGAFKRDESAARGHRRVIREF